MPPGNEFPELKHLVKKKHIPELYAVVEAKLKQMMDSEVPKADVLRGNEKAVPRMIVEYYFTMRIDREKIKKLYSVIEEKNVDFPNVQLKELKGYQVKGLSILKKQKPVMLMQVQMGQSLQSSEISNIIKSLYTCLTHNLQHGGS